MPANDEPLELAIIGVGPTASSLLERLSANVPDLLGTRRLVVHLIDPHRAGTGRVWRADLHPGLWMNSMAEDVTMFTDESVECDGPIRTGPSLHEWAHCVDDETLQALADPVLVAEIRGLDGMTFPTRRVQSVYLDWFHREVLRSLPANVEIVVHEQAALDVIDGDASRSEVVLDGADSLWVDSVVLTLGHLDAEPSPEEARLASFARNHSLGYVPPGHTAEQDLSVLAPGEDVIALGFGQAFTDLLVLVTEGRGGRFVEESGDVWYEPSGNEPIIHVGSRRGVPYRSKIAYRLQAPPARLPRFLDSDGIGQLLGRNGQLDFRRDVLPLVVKEVGWSAYHELFNAHPERVTSTWDEFSVRYSSAQPGEEVDHVVASAVLDPADRFDVGRLDRPLAGLRFDSAESLHRHVVAHIERDVQRRTDAGCSTDLGAFNSLLAAFGPLGRIAASGRLSERSRVDDLGRWWFSFFMYFASGPPPARLRQLTALADVGLVRFLGAGTTVSADEELGAFVATSASHPDHIVGRALIDSRIATPSVSRTANELLRRLHVRGSVTEEVTSDDNGWRRNTGKVTVTGVDLRVARADGSPNSRMYALGTFTSRPASGAFARPRTNAPAFRQNDVVARSLLQELVSPSAVTVTT